MKPEDLSDEILCEKAKNGDASTMNVILERYKYAVIKISRSYFLIDGDSEDLFQEGLLAVFKAVTTFSGKGAFKPYCYKCIKNGIISAIRLSNAGKNKPLNNYISLSGFSDGDDPDKNLISAYGFDPEKEILDKEAESELIVAIKDTLSKLEYDILALYLKGYSYSDIGIKTNKDAKSVDNALQRIRKKLSEKI